jgi:hypothetical protein
VERQWRLGWWAGPRSIEVWPLIGNEQMAELASMPLGPLRVC